MLSIVILNLVSILQYVAGVHTRARGARWGAAVPASRRCLARAIPWQSHAEQVRAARPLAAAAGARDCAPPAVAGARGAPQRSTPPRLRRVARRRAGPARLGKMLRERAPAGFTLPASSLCLRAGAARGPARPRIDYDQDYDDDQDFVGFDEASPLSTHHSLRAVDTRDLPNHCD